jgi:hypothetical protein
MRGSSWRALGLLNVGMLLLFFGTPVRAVWANAHAPWWLVYVLWGAAILGIYCVQAVQSAAESAEQGSDPADEET